jgi:hypothetical protein
MTLGSVRKISAESVPMPGEGRLDRCLEDLSEFSVGFLRHVFCALSNSLVKYLAVTAPSRDEAFHQFAMCRADVRLRLIDLLLTNPKSVAATEVDCVLGLKD